MKKIFCLIFCIILLSGCSKKSSEVTAITTGLSFNAIAVFENKKTAFDITISKAGIIDAAHTSSGISYKLSEDTVDISYGELQYSANISTIPEESVLDFIKTVFIDCSKRKLTCRNNQYFLEGKAKKYDYKAYFGATGMPLKIEGENFTLMIKNPTLITK